MANPTAANVAVGKPRATGGVYAGATSATLPSNAVNAVHSSLTALGYVSEDGLTQTRNGEQSPIRAWGGDKVRHLKTTDDLSYTWTFIETSRDVLAEVFGSDNIAFSDAFGGRKLTITASALSNRAFVFDMLDGDTAIRVVVPNGLLDGNVEVTFTDGEAISFPVTLNAFPDSSGNKAYWYLTQFAS
jgi:hypothetical protein